VKITNYKANQQKFQCLFALHPVFGPNMEYKFQIGAQVCIYTNRVNIFFLNHIHFFSLMWNISNKHIDAHNRFILILSSLTWS
jgi:hypothetical protein